MKPIATIDAKACDTVINAMRAAYKGKGVILSDEDIKSSRRHRPIVDSRQLCMLIMRDAYSMSYETIGNLMGGKNHATAIHGVRVVKIKLQVDAWLSSAYVDALNMLGLRAQVDSLFGGKVEKPLVMALCTRGQYRRKVMQLGMEPNRNILAELSAARKASMQ